MNNSLPGTDHSAILEVRSARVSYGDHVVLDGVDLSVWVGETLLIAGPNGCGKSTFLKTVMGELPLDAGEINFLGRSLGARSTEWRTRSGMGYLRQTDNVFPSLTVKENLQLAGLALPRQERRMARRAVLDIFAPLKERLSDRAGVLSGGLRQALALAMVFMRPQRLYLLDEPTAGLSPKSAADILGTVREYALVHPQCAVIMVEHRLDLLPWVSRTVFFGQGRVLGETTDISRLQDPKWVAKHFF